MGNGESTRTNGKKLENDISVTWKALKKCPYEPREGQCCAVVDNSLYVFGGVICTILQDEEVGRSIITNCETNELLKFDLKNNNWDRVEQKGDIPESRSGSTLTAVGEKLHLFGGLSENKGWVDDFYEFNTKSLTWTKIKDLNGGAPSPRDKLSSSVIGTDIYYFGGFGPQVSSNQLGDVIEEDSDNEQYEDLEIQEMEEEQEAANFTWFNDLHKYDTIDKSWSCVEPRGEKPTPRAAHSMCTINIDNLLVFGGRDTTCRTNDVWYFDPKTAYWTQVNPAGLKPDARSFHTAVSVGSRIVVLGGRSLTNEHLQDFHIYDTVQNHWLQPTIRGDTTPPATGMHSLALVGQYVVLCFGAAELDPITNSCTKYFQDTFAVSVSEIVSGGVTTAEPEMEKTSSGHVSVDDAIPEYLGLQPSTKKETNGIN